MYEERVIEIRHNAKVKKDRRYMYSNGDIEDLRLKELKKIVELNNYLLLKFLKVSRL